MELVENINSKIEAVEKILLDIPQVDCPVTHHFAPSVYMREIFMPAGTFVIGQEHKTKHFNTVLKGRAKVMMDGVMHDIVAPSVFVSEPGVRKILYILEDMVWVTTHSTEETNVEKLTELLVKPSGSYLDHVKNVEEFQKSLATDNIYLN